MPSSYLITGLNFTALTLQQREIETGFHYIIFLLTKIATLKRLATGLKRYFSLHLKW